MSTPNSRVASYRKQRPADAPQPAPTAPSNTQKPSTPGSGRPSYPPTPNHLSAYAPQGLVGTPQQGHPAPSSLGTATAQPHGYRPQHVEYANAYNTSGPTGYAQAFPPSGPPSMAGSATGDGPADDPVVALHIQNTELHHQVSMLQGECNALRQRVAAAESMAKFDRRQMMDDIMHEVDKVVSTHKQQAEAEVEKYKLIAENATQSLKNFRASLQSDGIELPMTASIAKFRLSNDTKAGSSAVASKLTKEQRDIIDSVSSNLLNTLVGAQNAEDVQVRVDAAVTKAFQALIVHFSDQVCLVNAESEAVVEALRKELQALKADAVTQSQLNDQQKVNVVHEYESKLAALRDEASSYRGAANHPDVISGKVGVHERALTELSNVLAEARRENMELRKDMENEKNHSAEVCLKLKTSLQKRSQEFEKAIVAKAEEVVGQHRQRAEKLEKQLRDVKRSMEKSTADAALQAGDSCLTLPSAELYVRHAVSSWVASTSGYVGDAPNGATSWQSPSVSKMYSKPADEQFEWDVWRKTQDLLQRYGGGPNGSFSADVQTPAASKAGGGGDRTSSFELRTPT